MRDRLARFNQAGREKRVAQSDVAILQPLNQELDVLHLCLGHVLVKINRTTCHVM
jgi:hypothetical protein